MRIVMVSFNLMYVLPTHFTEISYVKSMSHFLILFAANGSMHKRTYSQFGTIARHAIGLCSNVLPHSCMEVIFFCNPHGRGTKLDF